jgi:hypothetical protein
MPVDAASCAQSIRNFLALLVPIPAVAQQEEGEVIA